MGCLDGILFMSLVILVLVVVNMKRSFDGCGWVEMGVFVGR